MGDRFREHMFAHHLPLASNFWAFFCVLVEIMAKTQFWGVFLLALQHLDVREVSYLDVIGILTWI